MVIWIHCNQWISMINEGYIDKIIENQSGEHSQRIWPGFESGHFNSEAFVYTWSASKRMLNSDLFGSSFLCFVYRIRSMIVVLHNADWRVLRNKFIKKANSLHCTILLPALYDSEVFMYILEINHISCCCLLCVHHQNKGKRAHIQKKTWIENRKCRDRLCRSIREKSKTFPKANFNFKIIRYQHAMHNNC